MTFELISHFILIAVGVFVLIRSGVYIVRSLIAISHFLNVSEFTLSFILMAFATTLPEFSIGLNSAFQGRPIISLGNILGANILNLSLTLGLIALISGQLIVNEKKNASLHHHWFTLLFGLAPLILLVDLQLSRLDGLILILFFIVYLSRLFHLKELFQHRKFFWQSYFFHPNTVAVKHFLKNVLIFVVASGFLLFSASVIVKSAGVISLKIGLPELLVGMFIIALGTTLPELSFGLRAAFRQHADLSLGDLFGAATLNSTWILGIVALINPIEVEFSTPFLISAIFMILVLFLANLFLQTREAVSRKEGLILVLIYLIFLSTQLVLI